MLSIQDVLDYCDLDSGEIEAIAEHEHIPVTVAAEMSESLLCTPEGPVACDDPGKHTARVRCRKSGTREGTGRRLSAPAAHAPLAQHGQALMAGVAWPPATRRCRLLLAMGGVEAAFSHPPMPEWPLTEHTLAEP